MVHKEVILKIVICVITMDVIASDLGENINEIIDNLTEKYQQYIDKKCFSTNNRIKGGYSQNEIEFIKSSFLNI